MQNKGALNVADALSDGKKLKKGNARSDGKFYYLFDNAIFCNGFPTTEIEVRHRLLGHHKGLVYFTFAGWVTQSTLRHLRAIHPMCSRLSIKRGKAYFDGVELDAHRWYCYDDIQLLKKQQGEQDACVSH